jgi:3-oxoacyl-[acyl-carrier protein] reductase
MDLGFTGKGVLVTGGAGGIGSAVSRAFAADGAKVAVHYRTSSQAALELADEIEGVAIGADLRDPVEVDHLFAQTISELGRLDICVANAGVSSRDDVPVWELDPDRWRSIVDSNLTVTFLTARAFLRHAARTGSGSLVMIGSTAGQFGEAGNADYAAAKGAIMTGLLLSLKNEVARIGSGVRVNAVAPGWTVTPMIGDKGVDEEHIARVTSTMALKKLGQPEDVAGAVLALASDVASGHVTGQVITVAGGMEGRQIP